VPSIALPRPIPRPRRRASGSSDAILPVDVAAPEIIEAAGLRWIHIENPRVADRDWLEEHFAFHPLGLEKRRADTLRRVGARVVSVALIVEVMRVDPNDRAADAPGLRVPTDSISILYRSVIGFSSWFRLRASFGLAFGHHRQGGLDRETSRSRRTTLGRRLPIVMPDEQMR
jgi:hypothetical protein